MALVSIIIVMDTRPPEKLVMEQMIEISSSGSGFGRSGQLTGVMLVGVIIHRSKYSGKKLSPQYCHIAYCFHLLKVYY